MISETILRAAAVSATAAIFVASAVAAQPAMAAVAKPSSSGCGWTPANNSGAGGEIAYNNVNVRNGPSTSCNPPESPQVNAGQVVTIRCIHYNPSDGFDWYYLTIGTLTITVPPFIGWVRSDLVVDPFLTANC